ARTGGKWTQRLSLSMTKPESTEPLVAGTKQVQPEHSHTKRQWTDGEEFRPTYRPDIDGLRAVAVLGVVAYHAWPSLLPGGFVGVDIFFVISGYLITTVVLGGMQRGVFTFANFYAARVRRLFPALAVVLAATLAVGWYLLLPAEYSQLGKHALASAAFVS